MSQPLHAYAQPLHFSEIWTSIEYETEEEANTAAADIKDLLVSDLASRWLVVDSAACSSADNIL
jgi:hypothetical protein